MKAKYLKLLKKIFSIKGEMILLFGSIPIQILYVLKASEGMKLLAIGVDLLLFEGIALAIYYGRKEVLQELKDGTFETMFDFETLEDRLQMIKNLLNRIAQKKEIIFKSVRLPRRTSSKDILSKQLFFNNFNNYYNTIKSK